MRKKCTIYLDVIPYLKNTIYNILDENETSYLIKDESGIESWWSKSRFEDLFILTKFKS